MNESHVFERQYLDIAHGIIKSGVLKQNRTGVATLVAPGSVMIKHDMRNGFPMVTTCYKPFKVIATELEGFIKGITDKLWYQNNKCTIWDEWANPKSIGSAFESEAARKEKMKQARDLGPIYGYQWNAFNEPYEPIGHFDPVGSNLNVDWDNPKACNQLAVVFKKLKDNPFDRRMVVSAWNPLQIDQMALPPCHYSWSVAYDGERLHLTWNQRSADWALGVPFNMTSYALLLSVLCGMTGLTAGTVTGIFADAHIYENHLDGMAVQLQREIKSTGVTLNFSEEMNSITNPDEFESRFVSLSNYDYEPKIEYPIAV